MEGNKTLERAVRVYYHIMKIYHPTNLMAQFLLKGNTADRKQANIASSAKITGSHRHPSFKPAVAVLRGTGRF
jgi:hypothetical protein